MNVEALKCNPWRLVAAGCFPMLLASLLWQLISLDSLGPVPIGIVGLLTILARDVAVDPLSVPRVKGLWLAGMIAAMLYAGGVLIESTFVQLIAFGAISGCWILGLRGWLRSLGLLVLLILISLPQGLIQESLFIHLQRFAAGMASWALDLFSVPHIQQGAVLETPSGDLFVEEACSGMRSLLTGLVAGQAYLAWVRKSLMFSAWFLLGCAVLLIFGNCLRIFVISLLLVRFGIDWTSGWQHEMMGMLVFIGVLALMPGLKNLMGRVSMSYLRWRFPWAIDMDEEDEEESRRRSLPIGKVPFKILEGMPPVVLLSLLMMCAVTIAGKVVFRSDTTPRFSAEGDYPKLERIEMPTVLDGWKQDLAAKEVSVLEKYGLDQHVWCFRKDGLVAWIAADLPFNHLHQLGLCYRNRDWLLVGDGVNREEPEGEFSVLELRSKEGERPPMLVLFDNYDLNSNRFVGGVPKALSSRWARVMNRLGGSRSDFREDGGGAFCQIQVVVPGVSSLDSLTGQQAKRLFFRAKMALEAGLTQQILR
jgi:exosortase